MKILYVSQYFPPEMGAPAARAAELAHHWAAAGHDVSILTGFPNHPTGIVPQEWRPRLRRLFYREQIEVQTADLSPQPLANMQTSESRSRMPEARSPKPEVRSPMPDARFTVYRTWLWPLPNRKSHERIRNYASFFFSAALRGLTLPRPDVIIATSPQLLVALAGWWLAFARQIPFVFEVRDLWPESLAAVGVGSEDSLLHEALAKIAGFHYARADKIVVVSPAFKEHLIDQWHVPEEKIAVVENGAETDLFSPQPEASNQAIRRQLHAKNKFLVCYIGTMGNAHGLETLLAAAAQLKETDILFVLIGEGAEKARIQSQALQQSLTNILFLDQQPREKIPAFISASDACLVLLKKSDVFKTVIPTKMLEFMSCARPVILGVEGQAQQIVEQAHAGLIIEPENSQALAQAITELAANPEERKSLGQNGRDYIQQNFSRREMAEKYIHILEAIR